MAGYGNVNGVARSMDDIEAMGIGSAADMWKQGYFSDLGAIAQGQYTSGADGRSFGSTQEYLDYLYGGATPEVINGETWYKVNNLGEGPLPGRTPISFNPPPSTGSKLALGAIAAMAGAGFGGEAGLFGAEGAGWTSGFDLPMGGLVEQAAGPAGGWLSGFDLPMGNLAQSAGGSILDMLKKKYGVGGEANSWVTGLNILSGLYGLKQSRDIAKAGEAAAARMDPFGAQRPQYQAQLSALMADPSRITSMPGYKAGLDAVERKMASQGYIGSGNMMAALQEYGGSFFDKEAQRLAMLAGANIAPGGGEVEANALTSAANVSSQALATLGFSAKQIAQILGQK